MYRHDQNQLEFENFYLPFGGKLRSDDRWVKLAKLISWTEFEISYAKTLKRSGVGNPAKSIQVALGALIIKERLGLPFTHKLVLPNIIFKCKSFTHQL